MRKPVLSILALCLLLAGCGKEVDSAPDGPSAERAAAPIVTQEVTLAPDDPEPAGGETATQASDASEAKWPAEWKEVIETDKHTCVIDATVEVAEGLRETRRVYKAPFTEEYQQTVKEAFLRAGRDPRGDEAPEDALHEHLFRPHLIQFEWGGPGSITQPERWIVDFGASPGEEGHFLEHVNISEEEARAKAESLLGELGLGEGLTLVHAEKARLITSTEDNPSLVLCEGWEFEYGPELPGCISIYFTEMHLHGQMSIPYSISAPLTPTIIIMVTEDGVMEFCYYQPVRVEPGEPVEDELLDFEEVQRYFRRWLTWGLQSMGAIDRRDFDPQVERFVLSYAFCPGPNVAAELRPVWVAIFTTEHYANFPSNSKGYVCIDAITGAVVYPL